MLLSKTKIYNTSTQFLRYFASGGIAYLVDFGLLVCLTEAFHVYYLTSACIGFIAGSITVYLLSISWVFNKRTVSNKWFEFIIFVLIGIVGLGLNQVFIWFFTERVHLYYLISKFISTGIVFFWNYFARKYILFT